MSPVDRPQHRILDRHRGRVANREYLEILDRALTAFIDEATWIFARCWESGKEPLTDEVALVLYRHILEMADAIHILLLQSASVPARLQLRSMFEALLYLEYLLEEDTDRRARAYIVGSYSWGLRWARRLEKGSQARAQFVTEVSSDKIVTPTMIEAWEVLPSKIAETEEYLLSEDFAEIYRQFNEFHAGRNRWPHWYQVLTPKISGLKDLAVRLKRGAQYVMYDHWSRSMHPDLLAVHIDREEGAQGYLRELRDGTDIARAAHGVAWFLKDATTAILRAYRPDELDSFALDYRQRIWPLFQQLGPTDVVRVKTL